MNTVLLELNSYRQTAQIFIDGQEPSANSELNNFSYDQIRRTPGRYLDAIGRELNDDFSLQITANDYLFDRLSKAAQNDELCDSWERIPMKLSYSTRYRAYELSKCLPKDEFIVGLDNCTRVPKPLDYGPITVIFTNDEDVGCDYCFSLDKESRTLVSCTQKNLVSCVETFLIDPLIGRAVDALDLEKSLSVFAHINPIKVAECAPSLNTAERKQFCLTMFPSEFAPPTIRVESSNITVFQVKENSKPHRKNELSFDIIPVSVGEAEISATVRGENKPFFTKKVVVREAVFASHITFGLNKSVLIEGDTVYIEYRVSPPSAEDKNRITFRSSNSQVAEVVSDTLKLKSSGRFTLTAYGSEIQESKEFYVRPKLRGISIDPSSCTMIAGDSKRMMLVPNPHGAYIYCTKASSSKESVATVGSLNSNGSFYVKALKRGKCRISITTEDNAYEAACEITVKSRAVAKLKQKIRSRRSAAEMRRLYKRSRAGGKVSDAASWIWDKLKDLGLDIWWGIGSIFEVSFKLVFSIILLIVALAVIISVIALLVPRIPWPS